MPWGSVLLRSCRWKTGGGPLPWRWKSYRRFATTVRKWTLRGLPGLEMFSLMASKPSDARRTADGRCPHLIPVLFTYVYTPRLCAICGAHDPSKDAKIRVTLVVTRAAGCNAAREFRL